MMNENLNVLIISQKGHLQYQALLFAASIRTYSTDPNLRVHIAIPNNGPAWKQDPTVEDVNILKSYHDLDCEIIRFDNEFFGSSYPHSNKIYALSALPEGENFVFFDSDIVITGDIREVPMDFGRPSAKPEKKTWPRLEPDTFSLSEIWEALYRKFGITHHDWLRIDRPEDDRSRYPYFNAGCFYYRDPLEFFEVYKPIIESLASERPPELAGQRLYPWLDQIALPLVLAKTGGDANGFPEKHLDRTHSFHYHKIPILLLPRQKKALEVASGIVNSKRYRDLFFQDDAFRFYFRDGHADKVRAFIGNKGDYYNRNRPEYRKCLSQLNLWR